jgi:AAA15 family ATPase/GTPase
MLAGFKVANFLSFKEIQKFSMIRGRSEKHLEHIIGGKPELLDRAVIYGPNSAGKSNFMTAVAYAQAIAIGKERHYLSRSSKVVKTLEKMSFDGSDNPISYFEFLISLDNQLFSYGFEYDCRLKTFSTEWLVELFEDGSEREVFSISFENENNNNISNNADLELAALHKNDSGNSFLSQSKDPTSVKIYAWISRSLFVVVASDGITTQNYYYEINSSEISELFDLLKKLDTGIDGLHIDDPEAMYALADEYHDHYKGLIHLSRDELINRLTNDSSQYGEVTVNSYRTPFYLRDGALSIGLEKHIDEDNYETYRYDLDLEPDCIGNDVPVDFTMGFTHRPSHFEIPFEQESDGTKKILEILLAMFHSAYLNDKGYTVLYDEFECSIHVMLIKELLRIYDQRRTDHNMQFITTTHESRILTQLLYRNDEIWFVDSEENKGSTLYSLESFREADEDSNLDLEYLKGRFGAIPAVIEFLKEGDE